ncbi:MAG: hypothetical protein ACTHK8_18930 [Ginsengibacter sp.]
MITVLVKFEEKVETHPQLESITTIRGSVVEVEKLTELNKMFKNLVDVKILNTGAPVINIHKMFEKMEIHRDVTERM